MDEETKYVIGGISFFASVLGVWQWAASIHRRAIAQEIQHGELLKIVSRIHEIDEVLMDVLSHPNDSGFGVGDVEKRQEDILARLDRIETFIRESK